MRLQSHDPPSSPCLAQSRAAADAAPRVQAQGDSRAPRMDKGSRRLLADLPGVPWPCLTPLENGAEAPLKGKLRLSFSHTLPGLGSQEENSRCHETHEEKQQGWKLSPRLAWPHTRMTNILMQRLL